MLSETYPFDHLPSTEEIVDYFYKEVIGKPNGADGFTLWRDAETRDYCYIWVQMTYDLDITGAWLIEVRTYLDNEEVRRMIFTHGGLFTDYKAEELPLTVKFFGDTESSQAYARYYLGYWQRRITELFWS